VVATSGLGTLLGALVTPVVVRRVSKPLWVSAMLTLGALVELGLVLPYEEATFVLAGLAFGVVSQASKICIDTIVQENVDDAFRGRVFSVYDTLFNVAFVVAAAVAASVLPADGVSRPTISALAGLYAAAAGLYALGNRGSLLNPPKQ
jgi:predicted MFS family arabinose efflux permease